MNSVSGRASVGKQSESVRSSSHFHSHSVLSGTTDYMYVERSATSFLPALPIGRQVCGKKRLATKTLNHKDSQSLKLN